MRFWVSGTLFAVCRGMNTAIKRVRLTGKTKKGRERVKQHGEFWRVDVAHSLPHRLLLWSEKTGDWRWVWIDGEDVHFTVEVLG